jgi:glycosyltransferase involved in cell wall biosynthesis
VAPRITVGLPVYNGERFVGEAIKSVLDQTFTDFELVISDNASTDATEEICRDFAASEPRIRYVRSPTNMGGALNHNRCVELATAPFFKWTAHDDVIGSTLLERCLEALEADPSLVAAFPAVRYIDAEGVVTEEPPGGDLSFPEDDAGRRAWRLVRTGTPHEGVFSLFYSLVRRDTLERTRLHGTYIAADQVFVFELVLAGRIAKVPDATLLRRLHPESSMQTHRSASERAEWFLTGARKRWLVPHWTLMANHFAAVARSHASPGGKLRAYGAVLYRTGTEWRNLGGDVKQTIRSLTGRRG